MSKHGHGFNVGGGAAGAGAAGVGASQHDSISRHFGEGAPMPAEPVQFIFGDQAQAVAAHSAWWQAIELPGGLTMGLVALVAVSCLTLILASALVKTVVIRCSR